MTMDQTTQGTAVAQAEDYYDSTVADVFYKEVWGGGVDIHVGLYQKAPSIKEASRETVKYMASKLPQMSQKDLLIDIGAGFGGPARFLAERRKIRVDCVNLSSVQNARNREAVKKARLEYRIKVIDGNFEDLEHEDGAAKVVWSQDAIVHSDDRCKVLDEVHRVLQPGGVFIFTDLMLAPDAPEEIRQPIMARIKLESMGSPEFYLEEATRLGWTGDFEDLSHEAHAHYSNVMRELRIPDVQARLLAAVERERQQEMREYIDTMLAGLQHWVNAGEEGYLKWGIFRFEKN